MSLSVKIPTFFTNSIIFIIQRFFFSEFFFHCQILPRFLLQILSEKQELWGKEREKKGKENERNSKARVKNV